MNNLPWFKHYNSAHSGFTLRTLWDAGEFEAYSLFWVLLELISRFEQERWSGKLTVPVSFIQRETGWNFQRLKRVLLKINETSSEVQGIQVSINLDQTCELFVPKWLELQETRGGKRLAKFGQSVGRGEKREERRENTTSKPIGLDDLDLENLYQEYPRKEGKLRGMRVLRSTIKTQLDYKLLKTAIRNYAAHAQGKETQFIKMFSSFVGTKDLPEWREWITPETTKQKTIELSEDFLK